MYPASFLQFFHHNRGAMHLLNLGQLHIFPVPSFLTVLKEQLMVMQRSYSLQLQKLMNPIVDGLMYSDSQS